jgi:hypothetical protein
MTPQRTSPGGSFRLDKRVKGVGLIRVASGITDLRIWRDHFVPLWRELLRHRAEYLDLFMAIRDHRIRVDELVERYRRHGFESIPKRVEEAMPLQETVDRWLADVELTDKTIRDYRYCFNAIFRSGADVPDLPRLLAAYRPRARARMFNLTREVCRAFARDLAGRKTPLYDAVSNVAPKRVQPKAGKPCTPDGARVIAQKLGRLGGMWWTLCCTGMSGGPLSPYFNNRFTIKAGCILIHGTKRKGRDRIVPRITTPVRSMVQYQAFRRALKVLGHSPNDGRHTFKAWCEAAGVPKARIRRYMGHGTQDITDLYGQEYPVEQFLADDAARLRAYIGAEPRWLRKLENGP